MKFASLKVCKIVSVGLISKDFCAVNDNDMSTKNHVRISMQHVCLCVSLPWCPILRSTKGGCDRTKGLIQASTSKHQKVLLEGTLHRMVDSPLRHEQLACLDGRETNHLWKYSRVLGTGCSWVYRSVL